MSEQFRLVQRLREVATSLNSIDDPDEQLDLEDLDGYINEIEDEIRSLAEMAEENARSEGEEDEEADEEEPEGSGEAA